MPECRVASKRRHPFTAYLKHGPTMRGLRSFEHHGKNRILILLCLAPAHTSCHQSRRETNSGRDERYEEKSFFYLNGLASAHNTTSAITFLARLCLKSLLSLEDSSEYRTLFLLCPQPALILLESHDMPNVQHTRQAEDETQKGTKQIHTR